VNSHTQRTHKHSELTNTQTNSQTQRTNKHTNELTNTANSHTQRTHKHTNELTNTANPRINTSHPTDPMRARDPANSQTQRSHRHIASTHEYVSSHRSNVCARTQKHSQVTNTNIYAISHPHIHTCHPTNSTRVHELTNTENSQTLRTHTHSELTFTAKSQTP